MPKILKSILWIVVGVILLLLGILQVFYTDWFQEQMREELISRVNATQKIKLTLDRLEIDFPLDIAIEGLSVVSRQNDSLVVAKKIMASIEVFPLLRGNVVVDEATLTGANYAMGDVDSAMFMKIVASSLNLDDATVSLSANEIDLSNAVIEGGRVDLILKKDTTSMSIDTISTTPPTQWKVKAKDLILADFSYHMALESTIDSLEARFKDAQLADIVVDLNSQTIGASLIEGEGLEVTYIASITDKDDQNNEPASKPWLIAIDSIDLNQSKALYAIADAKPMPGMDFNYIQVDSLDIKIASFYNKASEISIPIKYIKARERCGVELIGKGVFSMDSNAMSLRDFDLMTAYSQLKVNAMLGTDTDISQATVAMVGNGAIAVKDVVMMFPTYEPFAKGLPLNDKIYLDVDVVGAINDMSINKLKFDLSGRANVDVKGYIANITDFNHMRGAIDLSGEIVDADFVNAIISDDADDEFVVPAMTLAGIVDIKPGVIDGNLKALANGGNMALNAKWNSRVEGYGINLSMNEFPIDAFLPRMGFGNLTGSLKATGQRFNPFGAKMDINAHAKIDAIEYRGIEYDDISLDVEMANNNAEVKLMSENIGADLDIMACCQFEDSKMTWDVNADIRSLDLACLALMEQRAELSTMFSSRGQLDKEKHSMRGALQIDEVDWRSDSLNLAMKDINTKLMASDSVINMALRNKDMFAFLSTMEPLDTIMKKVTNVGDEFARQIDSRMIDVEKIQQALPKFNLDVRAGSNNILSEYLSSRNQTFERFVLKASNDSMINLSGQVLNYKMSTTAIDTLKFEATQYDKILMYNASIGNRPGTLDDYAQVVLDGYVANDLVSAHLQQQNVLGEMGYNIGALAQVGDSIVRFELFPEVPKLAYKSWNINDDNFIEYNIFTRHIDADVAMKNATSSINIFTQHDSTSQTSHQEDVILKVKNLKLTELVAFNPYAPSIKGDMSADIRLNWGDGRLNGNGVVSLEEFVVGKERVGTFVADLGVTTDKSGQTNASASLMIDGEKTMTLVGCINDTTSQSPFMMDFSVIHFPLKVLNPMIPKTIASLKGTLNGEMKIRGNQENPIFNGNLNFDTTAVMVTMTGTPLNFSQENIPIVDNVVSFDNFAISGVNKNPLMVDGMVDIGDLTLPKIDLTLKARDMQIVGSNKSKRADVYGKGFIDIDAGIKGDLSQIDVDATINLLGGSNITYIIPDATSTITSYNTEDMVKFVKFSDTTKVDATDKMVEAMLLKLDVDLVVSDGSTINVDLSADGKNKVQLQGNGVLNYSMDAMADSRLTGRYTINKGFVRYTPPLMSEKLFNFVEGSYVAFNGDMLNPILSLNAIDNIKANVTQEGQDSRLVNFDVKLSVSNTLNNMNVAFDLSTPEDMTIANELSSMSAEQRANQAMNMLLYNIYTGAGSKANSNLSGNPLYSFVESKLNTWAANNIGFVDVSFGIDQYDKTIDGSTSKTTSYSYKVSKTMFNDRFKIVVGGNYSTDAETDENYSQNLINDISFEYMLNRSGTMNVKLFRKVGFESILEGEITQTGVGFVYKRKLKSLRDLFR